MNNEANNNTVEVSAEGKAFHGDTLAEFWRDFGAQCLPEDAPPYQLMHMRQAFLAGATCYRLAFGMAVRDGGDDNDKQAENVENLDAQLGAMATALVNDVMTGLEHAFDEALPNEPAHRVKLVDGRSLTPEQIEELDSIIHATVARFAEANRESAE